jgi:hypothetical protein
MLGQKAVKSNGMNADTERLRQQFAGQGGCTAFPKTKTAKGKPLTA